MSKKYDEGSIQRFAGLLGIRKKSTVYIGPTDESGLWTIWREPADNCVDRALAGDNDLVHLIQDSKEGVYWVVDNGPGIPVGKKKFENEHGKSETYSTLYVVTGLTHGGANFKGDTISRGTHGIGIKATNAMSKDFRVWTFRDGDWYCIEYKDAKMVKDAYKCSAPKLPHGIKAKKGTVVRFEPDMSLFRKGTKMDMKLVRDWCKLTSYLVPKLKVRFTSTKGKTIEMVTKGPADYINEVIAERKLTMTGRVFTHSSKVADIAVAFTDQEGDELVQCYTNGLHNKEGGEHRRAMTDALVRSLKPFSKTKKSKGKQTLSYMPSDLKDGLIGLVNYKIAAPQFNNQPKDRLIDERVYSVALPEFEAAWTAFWKKNPGMAKSVIARAELLRSKTSDFLKDKKLVKNINAAKKNLGNSSKLAAIIGSAPVDKRELFIVEGDSAGGSAKEFRDKSYQAVYALKGKPLNAMDAQKDKINNNDEIAGLLAAIGIDLTGKSNTIQYGKLILLTDSDVDGSHIRALLLGNLYKFNPSLFKNLQVYSVKSPLYKGEHREKVYFGMTPEEVYKQAGAKCDVTYLKGWGELNAEYMYIAMDPRFRKLYQIEFGSKESNKNLESLLGKNAEYRKKLFGVE